METKKWSGVGAVKCCAVRGYCWRDGKSRRVRSIRAKARCSALSVLEPGLFISPFSVLDRSGCWRYVLARETVKHKETRWFIAIRHDEAQLPGSEYVGEKGHLRLTQLWELVDLCIHFDRGRALAPALGLVKLPVDRLTLLWRRKKEGVGGKNNTYMVKSREQRIRAHLK